MFDLDRIGVVVQDRPQRLVNLGSLIRAAAYQDQDDLFRIDSWAQVLFGQGIEPRSWHRIAHTLPPEQLRRALADLDAGLAAKVARLPTQKSFIKSRYGGAPARASA